MKKRRTTKKKKNLAVQAQQKLVKAVLLLIFSFMAVIFFLGDHGVYQLYHIKKLRSDTQNRIEQLRLEKQELAGEKHRLETDQNYIESIAREKYRMAKSGEKVFKVIPRKNN
ncbi:MAG: septum formation initiator family protein [Draconibacterium sp.]|nr:septum formation initiator family protein [Draconibacterium sp.]